MDCRPSNLQDLAYGFLDDGEARLVRAHAARCSRCAGDLARLEAEKAVLAGGAVRADFAPRRNRLAGLALPLAFAAALLLGLVWTMLPPATEPVAFVPAQDKKGPSKEEPAPLDEASLRKEIDRLQTALNGTQDKQERNRIQAAIDNLKVELGRATDGKPVKKDVMVEKPVKKGPAKYDELTKALEQKPNDPALLLSRAEEGLKVKRWDASVVDAKKVIELEPKNARAHLVLSKALHIAGRKDEGDQAFAKAVELDPSLKASEPDIRLAKTQKELDAVYGKMKMTKDPEERMALEMKAKELGQEIKLLSQGDRTMVNIKEIEVRLQQNPDDVPALVDRAAWYLDWNKAEPALKDLNRAITLKADYAPAYLKRGIAHAMKGDMPAAWADVKRGEQLDPKNMKAVEFTQGTIKKLSGAKADKQRPAADLDLEINTLKDRLEELHAMAANAELPAAERDRAKKEAERVTAEIEKLKTDLQSRPPSEPVKKTQKK
jgi:tetratricopeptide (TPR) repeat protein